MHGESNKKWGKGLQGAGEFIRVVNASKVYQTQDGGEVEAFTNFNLEIEEDEFLVLVGPSGCGKSTLLKMIVGLLPPTRGAVYFQGTEVLSPRTDFGMVFQEATLLPWRSVRDNVMLPIEILGKTDKDYRAEAGRLLTLVGLHGLSGWMREPRATQDVDVIVALRQHHKATRALLAAFSELEAVELEVARLIKEDMDAVGAYVR